jgi:hypothetical protein
VLATVRADSFQIGVIKQEDAIQILPRRRAHEPAERSGLVVGEELHRHGST